MTGARDCPPKNRREVKISNEIISRTIAIISERASRRDPSVASRILSTPAMRTARST